MVNSVLAVSSVGKIKREGVRKEKSPGKGGANPNPLFSQLLQEEMESQGKAPLSCSATTYGQDSRLHTFEYQKREYHY